MISLCNINEDSFLNSSGHLFIGGDKLTPRQAVIKRLFITGVISCTLKLFLPLKLLFVYLVA